MTLSEVLRASEEHVRARADGYFHIGTAEGYFHTGTPTGPCISTTCPKCQQLALADECARYAEIAEREELAR